MPIAFAAAYLAINLALMLWIERARATGRVPARPVVITTNVLRIGPPLAGAIYLVALAGDWLFVLFVLGFFAAAFWLMGGLLSTLPTSDAEFMRGDGWHDPGAGTSNPSDRDRP